MNKSLDKLTKKQLQALVESLQTQLASLQQSHLRLQADLVNFKQRQQQGLIKAKLDSQQQLLLELLPLIDNLMRAFADPPADLIQEPWVKGVLGIDKQIANLLDKLGLQVVETLGKKFDPQTMMALDSINDLNQANETVVAEISKGYLYQDQVLRPAQVRVVNND